MVKEQMSNEFNPHKRSDKCTLVLKSKLIFRSTLSGITVCELVLQTIVRELMPNPSELMPN